MGWHEGLDKPRQQELRTNPIDGFDSNSELVNGLNDFYLCFNDEHDFTPKHSVLFDTLSSGLTPQFSISATPVSSMSLKCMLGRALGLI